MKRASIVVLAILASAVQCLAGPKVYRVRVSCDLTLAQQIDEARLAVPRVLYDAAKTINASAEARESCRSDVNIVLVYVESSRESTDQVMDNMRAAGLAPATAEMLVSLVGQYPSLRSNIIAAATVLHFQESTGEITSYFLRSHPDGTIDMVNVKSSWCRYTVFAMRIP